MFKVFEDDPRFADQDRASFKFRHCIAGHSAFELKNLAQVIPALPPELVYFSERKMDTDEHFETAISNDRAGRSIEQVIEGIRTSNAYIMVREPEQHQSFRELHDAIAADVTESVRRRGLGDRLIDPRSYLFISSPNSVTPFHFDRASNFLLQISGTKEIAVFPPRDPRVITQEEYEEHASRSGKPVRWKPEYEHLGKAMYCMPGDALHIPFLAGHHVKNGPELSITLSIFFNHDTSYHQLNALHFNAVARRVAEKAGIPYRPRAIGRSAAVDRLKSTAIRTAIGLRAKGRRMAGAARRAP